MSKRNGGGCLGKTLLIILAIAFFPVTLTILVARSNITMKGKLVSIAALWGVVGIAGLLFSPGGDGSDATATTKAEITSISQEGFESEETITESAVSAERDRNTAFEASLEDAATNITKTKKSSVESEHDADSASASVDETIVQNDTILGIYYPRPTGSPAISTGSKGDDVCWVQAALNKSMGCNLTVDGAFGSGTASKVIEFQSRCGLNADGVVDIATINMLVDVISGNKKLPEPPAVAEEVSGQTDYVLNKNTRVFHYPDCRSVSQMKDKNKEYYSGTREDIIARGFKPCGNCNP